NQLAQEMKDEPNEQKILLGKSLKKQLEDLESALSPLEVDFQERLKAVPNMPLDDVPIGVSPEQNAVIKQWGGKPQFDFQPKSHWEIGEKRGLIDKERAAKVSGSRFAYI